MKKYKLHEYYRGWFIGNFDPAILKTKDFEVSLQYRNKGFIDDEHAHMHSDEYTLVVTGAIKIKDEIYKNGDIFLAEKGEFVKGEVLEDTTILVIKIPSVPNDKIIK
jgi:hypothetical protein